MMSILAPDVVFDLLHLRLPDGESTIALLPSEFVKRWIRVFDPDGRGSLCVFDKIGYTARPAQLAER